MNYFYTIKDHLGSPRVTFTDADNDDNPEITDVKNYYSYGLEWDDTTTEGVPNYRQSYNDKEAVSYTNYLEFEARGYIKSINLFDGPDPISQKFPHLSTTNYAGLSPGANIDLHGLQAVSVVKGMLNRSTALDQISNKFNSANRGASGMINLLRKSLVKISKRRIQSQWTIRLS